MTLEDVDLWTPQTEDTHVGAPRKCAHPRRFRQGLEGSNDTICTRCGRVIAYALSRQNRNNRSRGLSLQRKVLEAMDLEHIPGNAENKDGRSRGENGLHMAECKSGLRFSKADWLNIVNVPAKAGQARWLVKVETPGPGSKARVTVSTTLEDWQSLFVGQPSGVEE